MGAGLLVDDQCRYVGVGDAEFEQLQRLAIVAEAGIVTVNIFVEFRGETVLFAQSQHVGPLALRALLIVAADRDTDIAQGDGRLDIGLACLLLAARHFIIILSSD